MFDLAFMSDVLEYVDEKDGSKFECDSRKLAIKMDLPEGSPWADCETFKLLEERKMETDQINSETF